MKDARHETLGGIAASGQLHTDMMRRVLRDVSNTQCRMFVYCAFLRHSFSLRSPIS